MRLPTMATLRTLAGFADVLPAESPKWEAVEKIARDIATRYDYHEIRTPTLESTALFHRGVGETSDMVRKETYSFPDRDGESVTLRPEGTAGVVRAVLQAGLLNDQGARAKVFYLCSNFRHEKKQKGRYREHHQFGVEAFGVAGPEQDVECIQLQMDFYAACGVKDLALRVNSLGDSESKSKYRDALVEFLSPKRDDLSADSQRRLESNPLRILDSKDPRDIVAVQDAPPAKDYLSEKSRAHFERVGDMLAKSAVSFETDGTLVRGFDYYTDTLWEVVAGGLGSQSAIGGGGRYDNLVEQLGGRPTPGVGFGSGIERLLLALEGQGISLPVSKPPLVWLMHHGPAALEANLILLRELRLAGLRADMDITGRAIKAQFKLADREGASYSLTTGEDELAKGVLMLKNFATKEQVAVARAEITRELTRRVTNALAPSR